MLSSAGVCPTVRLSALWHALPRKARGRAALGWPSKSGLPFEWGCSLAPPSATLGANGVLLPRRSGTVLPWQRVSEPRD